MTRIDRSAGRWPTLFVTVALGVAALRAAPAALAGELPDPTRPPIAQRHADAAPARAEPALVLQSVLTGAGRKPSVLISDQRVELGGAVAGMRLVRVGDGRAVLSGPRGSLVLMLTPDAEKLAAAAPAEHREAAASPRRGRKAHAPLPSVQLAGQQQ